MIDHALRPVTVADADIEEMAALLRVVFPDARHFTEAVVRWQYRDNPDGQVVGFNAWHGAVLAAHYVTIPLIARINGTLEKGLLSLNTATHPVHQGKGLFTKLANATYDLGREMGYGFVIGVANANSTHGFTRKLGFQLVSPLRAMVGIGQLPFVNGSAPLQYEHVLSDAALRWRLAHPAYRYSMAQSGDVSMLLSERKQFGARYVLTAGKGAFPQCDLERCTAPRRKVFIGLDPSLHWGGSFYANVPMRFRPSPLNLIFKDLTRAERRLEIDRVRFHAIDFDIL